MRIAVVGCGYWGKNLVRTFWELGALTAICDDHANTAQELSQKYGIPAVSFTDILADPQIDGIAIAAPAVYHAFLAESALRAHKHVFVEKPLALTIEEGKALCNLAHAQKKILMVGHLLQYHSAFQRLKKLVDEGKLGVLQHIYAYRLNLGKIRTEEDVLWSFAPHDVSMILALAGDRLPEKVFALGSAHLKAPIVDMATMHLFFSQGLHAQVSVSWLNPEKEQKLVVVGDKGMAIFNDRLPDSQKLQYYEAPIQWENDLPVVCKRDPLYYACEAIEPLKEECAHFLDCITTNKTPRTDGEEGVRVLHVLSAATQSMKTGQSVALTEQTYFCHETAYIDEECRIGEGTKIWHFSHILKGSTLGKHVVVGQNAMIGPEVTISDFCKIQNNVSLYKGVVLEEGVFCGPSCVFTNVMTPRAQVERKDEFLPTYVEKGVTIGANATVLCGLRLGAYALIGAGAVVTRDVKPHALMVGSPARQRGWVSHAGEKLGEDLMCRREGRQYYVDNEGFLQER